MVKIIFILFYVLQGPTGEDVYKMYKYDDRIACEQHRKWLKQRNIIVADSCQRAVVRF